jgi:phosphoribosyl-AMP cyclohydrolase
MNEADLMEKLDWSKGNGLIPVVVQDAKSNAMLMLAYANKEALEKTLSTGYAHYWSRSRGKLWMKGETSGHTQKIKRVVADCDYDALLYVVEQKGPVCHTGAATCFHHDFEC